MNEAEFQPLDAADTVVREGQALVQRYRLLRQLRSDNGLRMDLRGTTPEQSLVDEMIRQLVPGVDGPLDNAATDWPIRGGVRLEALCFSPWLANVVVAKGLYQLPATSAEFAALFETKTGIGPESHAMDRNYRVTPIELGRVAEEIRGSQELPSSAYLLLRSRHFAAAVNAAPMLSRAGDGMRFGRPLIDGFRLLAELEREALLVEDLSGLNLLSARRIRQLIDGKPATLAREMRRYPQLKRLFDYAMIGSDVIGGFHNADHGRLDAGDLDYMPSHPSLRVVAATEGGIDADVVKALTVQGELSRITLRAAFPDPDVGTRANPLANDEPATFYGLNSIVAGAMQADLGRAFDHGDATNAADANLERQAMLAATIIARCDVQLHARNARRTSNLGRGRQPTGTNRQRNAEAYGELILPALETYGSAPRASIDLWGKHRWADAQFWRVFLDRSLGDVALGLNAEERARIKTAFSRLEVLFGRTFQAGTGAADWLARNDALRAVCDMASAVSAISTNRYFPRAILSWLALCDVEQLEKSIGKSHGARWLPSVAHVLNVRRKKGSPPVGKMRQGAPRNRRSLTSKRNALRARQRRANT